MQITRENGEIVIRIPSSEVELGVKALQELIDCIVYRQLVAKSKATREQIDELAREVNKTWWEENENRLLQS